VVDLRLERTIKAKRRKQMKKPKLHAKALYLIFALALVIGLMPLTVLAGEATIYVSGPCYAKVGEAVNFTAFTDPTADQVNFFIDGVVAGTDTTAPFQLLNYIFLSAGTHNVLANGHWGANLVQNATFEILIGTGLIPQEGYNIIGTDEEFCVPTLYQGHVTRWWFEASPQLNGNWGIVSGGKPRDGVPGGPDNCVTVHASGWGELFIHADTAEFTNPLPPYNVVPATTLDAVKKWGKIYDTLLFGWDEYNEEPIYGSGETQVWWCEDCKSWIGGAYLYDLIIGNFTTNGGEQYIFPANGADVEWWVMDARAPVHDLPSGVTAEVLVNAIEIMQTEWPSRHVGFGNCDTKSTATVSGDANIDGQMTGLTGVELVACGEEAVKIVVVAKCPGELHYNQPGCPVFPEIISWNFWTQEVEKVPQVAWAGEEIVLEKQFGVSYAGNPVNFILEGQSIGALEGLSPRDNRDANGRSVWTTVDDQGVARALLHSQSQGKSNVICLLYEQESSMELINKHGFMVYWLAIEEVTLGNMQGQRLYHNDGMWCPVLDSGMVYDAYPNDIYDPTKNWTPDEFVGKTIIIWKENMGSVAAFQVREIIANTADTIVVNSNWDEIPNIYNDWYYMIVDPVWDPTLDDLIQTLNVSQDALLRVRVKGWFYDPERESIREKSWCDANANGVKDMYDYVLPEGRWVLPDDWEYLAGPDWEQDRPHWDIMTQPNDNIMSEVDMNLDHVEARGDYLEWTLNVDPNFLDIPGALIAEFPVIGPYSTLDNYTPYVNDDPIPKLDRKTIIRNGKLNWWDSPMPPAKIMFEVTDGAGFFKDTDKADVYYQWVNTISEHPPVNDGIVYTNPFYMTMIPASPFIPPFVNNGGYDWDSWDWVTDDGPYPFWTIINQPPGMTPYDDQHPTKVQVYSDNHGEAMVFLNGDWNLDLSGWLGIAGYNIPTGAVVANTTVIAGAEYPYFRGEFGKVLTNNVTKIWTWGKDIRGPEPATYPDGSKDPVDTRMVFQVDDVVDCENPELTHYKMAFIWVCDRDGFPTIGERVEWSLGTVDGTEMATIPNVTGEGVSICLPDIDVQNGFLAGTLVSPTGEVGGVTNPDRTTGVCFLKEPGPAELALWDKFWPDEPCHHSVGAVVIYSDSFATDASLTAWLYEREGVITRQWNIDFSVVDNPDDPLMLGDANQDCVVNTGDITKVKRIYFGIDPATIGADANQDKRVDAGDITKVKNIYFGA
jgi:hypothetical protein